MKIKLLLAATILLSSIKLGAVQRLSEPQGQVLLFPFYTVENGWDTYLNITPPEEGILLGQRLVMRLRFMDGVSGLESNSFNVYLDSDELFRASISSNESGMAVLTIAEGSCVLDDSLETGGLGTTFPLSSATGMVEAYYIGVLGIFPPKTTLIAVGPASRGFPEGITFL